MAPLDLVSCDQETQTVLDEPSRYYFEETHDLKLKIVRLEEQVRHWERRLQSEEAIAGEKISAFESHMRSLEDENNKLGAALRAATKQQSGVPPGVARQLQEKD